MNKIETGGPAFPVSTRPLESEHGYGHQDGASTWQFGGMTLRDFFAAKAMPVVYADYCAAARTIGFDEDWKMGVALDAYAMADAMLAAREAANHEDLKSDLGEATDDLMTNEEVTAPPKVATGEDREGWIEWKGGKRPVPADTQVEVQLAEIEEIDSGVACAFTWEHRDSHFKIVAYRVLKKGSAA